MMDQYKEQYKTETEEIHAPADLIARTKAAVREEKARIQREFAAQEAELAGQPAKPVAQNGRFPAQEVPVIPQKSSRGTAARRWAYPLSAAAAVIVLASVSLMMRGLGKSSSESPAYEMAAADSGAAESAAAGAAEEGAFDEAFPEESAAVTESAAADTEAAEEFAAEETAGAVAETDDAASDMGMAFADAAMEAETAEETKRAADELSAGEGEIENAMSQKQEAKGTLADTAAAEITVEKVWKKPAFVNRKDVETRNYEDMVFQIVEEEDGWAAYVESETGGGYVIRGEAESIDAFLEAGYKRLEEA